MSEMGGEERARPQKPAEAEPDASMGRYLVAPRPQHLLMGGVRPMEQDSLFTLLDEDRDIHVLDRVFPERTGQGRSAAQQGAACPPVAVVRMRHERAAALAANPGILVEPDRPLTFNAPSPIGPAVAASDPAVTVSLREPAVFTVRVTGRDGAVVPGAHVWAIGAGWPAHAVTDVQGRATLTLPAGTPSEICALHVRPAGGYWPVRINNPGMSDSGQETQVRVIPLRETFEGFPERSIQGWGEQAMRLHQLPPTYRGHGISVALLDSGVSAAHPDLRTAVTTGYDAVADRAEGWDEDATGHGTACAGVIAAADNRTGITGIAAEATVHSVKLHPGGRVSHLLRALDWCIAHEVDIAQINLFCPAASTLVALKILDARASGVVCVAPAGDDGTAVAFPARAPGVLAVGAIGHAATYPPGTPHAAHLTGRPSPEGLYAPGFTPLGPGVDLSAPGVAVVTTVPGDSYAPCDGTAIAASHITGLAALVLTHHDTLRTETRPRTAARVDHVHAMLRGSCRPVPGLDPLRTGAGVPDAPSALGLQPAIPTLQPGPTMEALLATLQAEMQRYGLVMR